jgi:hypothetical protein
VTPARSAPIQRASGTRSATGTVRGTQLLVEHMGETIHRPSLTAIEVLWRWLVGIPCLLVGWHQLQQILASHSLQSSGFYAIDKQNPWIATVQFVGVWDYYEPHVFAVLRWLLPCMAAAWIVVSGLGRSALLHRMEPGTRWRPFSFIALQGAWVLLFAGAVLGWLRSMHWAAATHISTRIPIAGEPDLIGYFVWAICLSLGFFTLFALVSWVLSIAPILMLLEPRHSVLSALGEGFRLGKPFASKLTEINLVMGIVKLALIVVAMVFSAAPLPFIDQLGPEALHVVWVGAVAFYLVENDYFQVVRLKAFVEFWKVFRGSTLAGRQASESTSQHN